jgi:hypothetical protein
MCTMVELPKWYILPFQLLFADGTSTPNLRYAPVTQYANNPRNPWRGYEEPTDGHTGPWTYSIDRQVAYVQWLNVTQGVYVCANGGNCTAPDVCECAPGWIGFDCRTPVCEQGYYHSPTDHYEPQTHLVSGLETRQELQDFLPFMHDNPYRLSTPESTYSNPSFQIHKESIFNKPLTPPVNLAEQSKVTSFVYTSVQYASYFAAAAFPGGARVQTAQGGYRCSVRSMTQWENREFVSAAPNYFSRYMNPKVERDDIQYTFWNGSTMHWPPLHRKSHVFYTTPSDTNNITYIYTNEGYRLNGIWNRTSWVWEYGTCIPEFDRVCSDDAKDVDLQSGRFNAIVQGSATV